MSGINGQTHSVPTVTKERELVFYAAGETIMKYKTLPDINLTKV